MVIDLLNPTSFFAGVANCFAVWLVGPCLSLYWTLPGAAGCLGHNVGVSRGGITPDSWWFVFSSIGPGLSGLWGLALVPEHVGFPRSTSPHRCRGAQAATIALPSQTRSTFERME